MDRLDNMERSIGRIEGKLDGIEVQIKQINSLNERVSALEHWQAWLKGGWAVLATAFTYVFSKP